MISPPLLGLIQVSKDACVRFIPGFMYCTKPERRSKSSLCKANRHRGNQFRECLWNCRRVMK